MPARTYALSVALLASLAVAAACQAAEPGGGPGRGGIGGQIGFSDFYVDRAFGSGWFGDYSEGARPRFAFWGHWRYRVNGWLGWQVSTGFTWAGYPKKSLVSFPDPNFPTETSKHEYLTLLVPVSAQVQLVRSSGWWTSRLSAGPSVCRVWVENHRKVLKDPQSLKLHRGVYPGGSAEISVEHFFRDVPSTSLELAVGGDIAFAQRHAQFVSGFDSNVMALEIRFGEEALAARDEGLGDDFKQRACGDFEEPRIVIA